MNKIRISSFCIYTIVLSSFVYADNWVQYRGLAGDGASSESIGNVNWETKPPKVLWTSPTPLGFSSLAVADGRVFTIVAREVSGKKLEVCLALDAESGRELWGVQLGESDYGHDGGNSGAPDNRGGDGPRATPASDGKLVFVYDSHMLLSCLNASNGELVWKHDIVEEFGGQPIKWRNASSPLFIGDVIYVGGGGKGQSFLAFNKETGKLIWKSGDETITHATPCFAEIGGARQVIFFAQSGLVGIAAEDGKELWRSKFPFSVSSAASPVVEGSRVYCSAGYGVGSAVFEVSASPEAKEVWFKPNRLMNHWSTPVIRDGHLYGIYEFKKYGKAPLLCVELATGEIKWSQLGFGPGNCILVGDNLVVLSDSGEVVIASASPDKYTELGRVQAVKGKCWSTPAFSNGRIYVRSTEEAACLDVN
ncbi:MAG: outer membrane protein assembly factor BamB [Pirellulaceae bacterium]|jgi:outer membrane protein assembly factor BamB